MKVQEFCSNNYNAPTTTEQLVGIEFEVEQVVEPFPTMQGTSWLCEQDGSLRDNGMEFISRPINIAEAQTNSRLWYNWKSQYNWNVSARCSTHIHVDARPYTITEVGAILTTYALLEPLMFHYCGEEREQNIYCIPWYRGTGEALIANTFVHRARPQELFNANKYSALYMEPLLRFGTLEFRQAPVFDTYVEFNVWLNLCTQLVSKGVGFETAEQVIDQAIRLGADGMARHVWGPYISDAAVAMAEDLTDEADSLSVAETIAGTLCTYNAAAWVAPTLLIEGEGVAGYHTNARRRYGAHHEPEYYDDDDYPEDDID